MDSRFYVYALLDPRKDGRMEFWPCSFLEEPFYIGKGTGRRAKLHGCPSSRSPAKMRIDELELAGERASVLILADGLTEPEAFAAERYWIEQIGRLSKKDGPLLNRTLGGQGSSGMPCPQTTREAVSRAHKGKPKGHGAKISATKRANPKESPFKGVPRDPETVRKISEAQRGKPRPYARGKRSPEVCAKISEARKGYKPSPESVAKMAATKRGKPNLKQRGVPKPAHVIAALRAGFARPDIGKRISEGRARARAARESRQ